MRYSCLTCHSALPSMSIRGEQRKLVKLLQTPELAQPEEAHIERVSFETAHARFQAGHEEYRQNNSIAMLPPHESIPESSTRGEDFCIVRAAPPVRSPN